MKKLIMTITVSVAMSVATTSNADSNYVAQPSWHSETYAQMLHSYNDIFVTGIEHEFHSDPVVFSDFLLQNDVIEDIKYCTVLAHSEMLDSLQLYKESDHPETASFAYTYFQHSDYVLRIMLNALYNNNSADYMDVMNSEPMAINHSNVHLLEWCRLELSELINSPNNLIIQ